MLFAISKVIPNWWIEVYTGFINVGLSLGFNLSSLKTDLPAVDLLALEFLVLGVLRKLNQKYFKKSKYKIGLEGTIYGDMQRNELKKS